MISLGNETHTPPEKTKSKHARSRGGCTRCRSRRQKCDEQRPMCSRCKEHNIDKCVYTVSLQWGGRNFQSYARNSDIKKYETEPGTFVYVSSSKQGISPARKDRLTASSPIRSPRSLSPLDSSTPLEQQLLHHFAHSASRITSCHYYIQSEYNHLLLPMALSYPPLLSALMALSAIHRNSMFSGAKSPSATEDNAIISLKASSITQLRSELVSLSQTNMKEAALATALTLCMCEIHSGADQPRSWRLHLEGAREILASTENPELALVPTSAKSLLERWYTSIEALAAISSKGLNAGQMTSSAPSSIVPKTVYLDDYFGFSTDLVESFKEIGAAAWERRSLTSAHRQSLLSEQDLQDEAQILESSISLMIQRDAATPLTFYPGVSEQLQDGLRKEFYLCNEAYQHTALLHIHRNVRQLPVTDPKVQYSVKKILDCVEGIEPRGGLSPYIVLTMPLFTAGKEALGNDREIVRVAMSRLGNELKLKNVWKSLEFLETYWETGMGGTGLDEGEEHDFIPY